MAEDSNREEQALSALMDQLAGSNRRRRQEAARLVAAIAAASPDQLLDYTDDLLEALERPEAQTRWQVLDTLTLMAAVDSDKVAEAFDGAEASLFDDSSAAVRLSAFKFLARLGASSPENADKVWPLLDEAIQCYHGDPEYHDMLIALLEFAGGNLSDKSRDALIARVSFDAENGQGFTKGYSTQIIAAAKGGE